MNIPEEAIAPAVNAFRQRMATHGTLLSLDPTKKAMRQALQAAAPFIAAQAWQEGADAAFYDPDIRGFIDHPANPYRMESPDA